MHDLFVDGQGLMHILHREPRGSLLKFNMLVVPSLYLRFGSKAGAIHREELPGHRPLPEEA